MKMILMTSRRDKIGLLIRSMWKGNSGRKADSIMLLVDIIIMANNTKL